MCLRIYHINPANDGDKAIRAASMKKVSLSEEITKMVNQDPGKYIEETT